MNNDIKEALKNLEEGFDGILRTLERNAKHPNLSYRQITAVTHLLEGSRIEMEFPAGLEYMEDAAFRLMHFTDPGLLEYYRLHHLRNPKAVEFYVEHGKPPDTHE